MSENKNQSGAQPVANPETRPRAPSEGVSQNQAFGTQHATSPRLQADDVSRYAVTVSAPVESVYRFCRDFSNVASFMKDIKSVEVLSPTKSHWVAQAKNGYVVQWDAEIVSERANEMLSWKSVPGSQVETSGTVWFRQLTEGRGTVVSLAHDYHLPGGKVAEWLTALTGDNPEELAHVNLRRLKGMIETGVIATTDGQPSGREADAKTLKH